MSMGIAEEIQKQKELLYLNSLKVANQTLSEADDGGYEVSSGVLSASASLLKLKFDDVIDSNVTGADLMRESIQNLINQTDADDDKKKRGVHYKEA
jgi:hypothetical protein